MSYLPHLYPVGGVFFITFRLNDSLPQSTLKDLRHTYDQDLKEVKSLKLDSIKEQERIYNLRKRIFGKYDHQLDVKPYGDCYLNDEAVAKIIWDKIWQYHGMYYEVIAISIMPNHVHMLLDTSIQIPKGTNIDEAPKDYVEVGEWMKLIKGGSAYKVNKYLGRKGKLWARESYDHFARDEAELDRIRNYIIENPKKAGLASVYFDAPFLFSNI